MSSRSNMKFQKANNIYHRQQTFILNEFLQFIMRYIDTQAAFEISTFVTDSFKNNPEQQTRFEIRIGINSGPVVAGVVGTKKFAYERLLRVLPIQEWEFFFKRSREPDTSSKFLACYSRRELL